MWVHIPARGHVASVDMTPGTASYLLLGPLPADSVIRRFRVGLQWAGDAGGGIINWRASVGAGPVADAASLLAGSPLIHRSNTQGQSMPSRVIRAITQGSIVDEIYPGVQVQTGSQFVVVGLSDDGSFGWQVIVSCECSTLIWLPPRVSSNGRATE